MVFGGRGFESSTLFFGGCRFESTSNFFFLVYQSIASHIFINFVRPHVCWCVSVDVAFYLKWGFGRQGCGFESGSWFMRDVGLNLDLGFQGTWV